MIKTLINIMLLVAVFTFATAQADDNVFRAQFTTQVSGKEPVDNLKRLENVFTSVYFFTDIRECVNCKVEHVWYLNGKHVYTLKGTAKYARYRWWSRKTLNNDMLGKWMVKVKINGKVRLARALTYFAPTATQVKQAPIEKRLQLYTQDECETNLKLYSDAVKAGDDPYDTWMLNKWGKRCYGE